MIDPEHKSMMFPAAVAMLGSARSRLAEMRDNLTVGGRVKFRHAYQSCVTSIVRVHSALKKDGGRDKTFKHWLKSRMAALEGDPLWTFFLDERNRIEHEGRDNLQYYTETCGAFDPGPPPFQDARFAIRDNTMWWVQDLGGAKETWHPVQPKVADSYLEEVHLGNAPAMHMGKPLASTDPISICEVGIQTIQELVQEARDQFARIIFGNRE